MEATKKTNSNKDYMLRVRMEENTLKKLDEISKIKGTDRSKTVRDLIDKEFEELNKNK